MPSPLRSLAGLLAGLTAGSLALGGALGAAVIAALGPELAMGLAIWGGWTTEPARPDLPFPWPAMAALLLAWVGAQAWAIRREDRRALALGAATAAAAGAGILPWIHLYRLWTRT